MIVSVVMVARGTARTVTTTPLSSRNECSAARLRLVLGTVVSPPITMKGKPKTSADHLNRRRRRDEHACCVSGCVRLWEESRKTTARGNALQAEPRRKLHRGGVSEKSIDVEITHSRCLFEAGPTARPARRGHFREVPCTGHVGRL